VVERPGRSTVKVTTPMTGIITRIYPIEGESAQPGEPLFELRLTHEEIVQAQADLLRTAEELDVVAREIERLEKVSANGAIAGKTLLERQYEQQKLLAVNRSQQQALLLHGLSQEQVAAILKDRALLQKVTINAPSAEAMSMAEQTRFQIQDVSVSPGQHVEAGDSLAVLIDYASLLVEGNAFEADAALIDDAARQKQPVVALLDREGGGDRLEGLKILYQASRIDPETRTIHFYVVLPNEVQEEDSGDGERSFLSWKYRPGQRMRLLVPAETWAQRIVLPVDAVAQDGVETYVFVPNGDHFDRRPVHVEYRDDISVVIENDGALFPGDMVAVNGAQQLQLAIKNKSGGAIDPHAGHNH
jgi:multidrug efflux pump subunit AcrA (membrane-fusion protein)